MAWEELRIICFECGIDFNVRVDSIHAIEWISDRCNCHASASMIFSAHNPKLGVTDLKVPDLKPTNQPKKAESSEKAAKTDFEKDWIRRRDRFLDGESLE